MVVILDAKLSMNIRSREFLVYLGFSEFLMLLVLCLIMLVIPAVLAIVIARRAGASSKRVPCPYCAEIIQPQARICRFCGKELPQ